VDVLRQRASAARLLKRRRRCFRPGAGPWRRRGRLLDGLRRGLSVPCAAMMASCACFARRVKRFR